MPANHHQSNYCIYNAQIQINLSALLWRNQMLTPDVVKATPYSIHFTSRPRVILLGPLGGICLSAILLGKQHWTKRRISQRTRTIPGQGLLCLARQSKLLKSAECSFSYYGGFFHDKCFSHLGNESENGICGSLTFFYYFIIFLFFLLLHVELKFKSIDARIPTSWPWHLLPSSHGSHVGWITGWVTGQRLPNHSRNIWSGCGHFSRHFVGYACCRQYSTIHPISIIAMYRALWHHLWVDDFLLPSACYPRLGPTVETQRSLYLISAMLPCTKTTDDSIA